MTVPPKNQANPTTRPSAAQTLRPSQADPARSIVKLSDKEFKELKTQAKTLVGTTFYAQMLKQMRDSPFKSDLFDGGRGGQAYASMYDQQLATRMAQRTGDKLVRPVVMKAARLTRAEYNTLNKEAVGVTHDLRA